MKKIIVSLLLAVMLAVPFAFSEETDPMEAVQTLLDVDIILANHRSVSVNRIYYDYDGNEMFSTYLFAGKDEEGRLAIVSEDSEGNVEVLSESGCAGFDTWSMKMYMMGFVLDEYEENISQMKMNFFADVRLNEKFYSQEIRDGRSVITTKTYYQGDFEGGCDTVEYVSDSQSGELLEIYEYFEDETGARTLNSKAYILMDAEYEMNPVITELFEAENTRSVAVHLPDGGETVFSVPADTELMLIYPEEYVLYEDEMKTRMYAGEDPDADGLYPDETHLYLDVFG